jgi:hypothetical protein
MIEILGDFLSALASFVGIRPPFKLELSVFNTQPEAKIPILKRCGANRSRSGNKKAVSRR